MKNTVITLFTLLLLTGCAPKMGKIQAMGEPKSSTTAEISIVRNYNFTGAGIRLYPTINDKKIAGLYTKSYVHFNLKEGSTTFGLMYPDVVFGKWKKGNNIEKYIEAKKQYYFLVSPIILGGFEIEEIEKNDAEERISSSILIATGTYSGQTDPLGKIIHPVADLMGLDEDDGRNK